MNNGFPNPTPGDAMPFVQAAVWPPPPVMQPQASAWSVPFTPFKYLYRRAAGPVAAKANIADFREGKFFFDEQGVVIDGRACPRAEIRYAVIIPCACLGLLFGAVASYILEFAVQHPERIGVPWDQVKQIAIDPAKPQGCLVYEALDYKGRTRTFSLGFTMTPGYDGAIRQAARAFVPDRLQEIRLKNATSPRAWIVSGVVIVAITVGLLLLVMAKPH